jgi:NAD(P)-dependent dehydrogenase (short-subunit alcohol dehydrogenase family)
VAVADISPAGGEETVRLVREAGGEAVYVETDVTDPLSVERAIKSVADRWGKLDILYNNAGGSTAQDGRVTEVSIEEWWRAIRLDLFGTFLCCKFGIPQLIRAGGGAVINTTSVVALCGVVGRDAYTAAKGGVLALTRSMAVEYGKHHVQVNVLAPGATLTERVRKFLTNDPRTQATDDKHLLGLGEPEDVARTALFLASDDARRITGAVFPVDSGWSAA